MLAPWLKSREPILLVGPEGCGKTALIQYCFKRLVGVQVGGAGATQSSMAVMIAALLMQCEGLWRPARPHSSSACVWLCMCPCKPVLAVCVT